MLFWLIAPCFGISVPCVMCCIVHRIIRQMTRYASAFDLTQLPNFFSLHYFVSSTFVSVCLWLYCKCVCVVAFAFRSRNHTPNIRFRSCEISIHGIRRIIISVSLILYCLYARLHFTVAVADSMENTAENLICCCCCCIGVMENCWFFSSFAFVRYQPKYFECVKKPQNHEI